MIIYNLSAIIGLAPENGESFLRGSQMSRTSMLTDAWMRVVDGVIVDFGTTDTIPESDSAEERVDGRGGMILPAFCDSHTHLVYPASRSLEFLDKINGLTYEEIAARGGGILNSADTLASLPEDTLFDDAMHRVNEVIDMGTGALEIKSGYGLTLETELKMLRVIARIAEATTIPVRATFLGAHAVGRAYAGRQGDYVRHIVDDMLPAVAAEGLAQYVDVFCDRGFFTPDETAAVLEAAANFGMRPKIHANELDVSGGVEVGVAHGALSVDHLERAEDEQLRLLGESDTVATMLPGASFFLGMPYGDARRAIARNAIVALASDFNPGSSPSGDMRFVWALGCIKMRLTPVEAFNAVTVNGAYALGVEGLCGTIRRGAPANLILTKPEYAYMPRVPATNEKDADALLADIPYRYTRPWIARRILP